MKFTAIDIETAIGKRWSICQIGIVRVENSRITDKILKYVQPPNNEYSEWNIRIHGIEPNDTLNSPIFPEIWDDIKHLIENELIVAHNADFDIDCLYKTLEYYNIPIPNLQYDCTFKITGLKLNNLCEAFEITLDNHHNAECDALACAEAYLKIKNNCIPDYSKVQKRTGQNYFEIKGHERIKGDLLKKDLINGDKSSIFYNKKVVFTGALNSITREKAAEIIKSQGADIDTGISKKTDYVITGKSPGPSKMKKIEKYNSENSNIQIILENEFLNIIKNVL